MWRPAVLLTALFAAAALADFTGDLRTDLPENRRTDVPEYLHTDLAEYLPTMDEEEQSEQIEILPLNRLRDDPNADCPVPPSKLCPAGFGGQDCEILRCPTRGSAPPGATSQIDISFYPTSCDARRYLAVDSHVTQLYLFVDGAQQGANPKMMLSDPSGNPVMPTKVIRNDTKTLEIQYAVNKKFGYYALVFSAGGGPCRFQANVLTDLKLTSGFTQSSHDDAPTATIQQNKFSYFVMHMNGLPTPGRAAAVEVYQNAKLQYSYPLSDRFGCAYDQYAQPIICSTLNTYWYKVYGRDENGYDFERTAEVSCVRTQMSTTPNTGTMTTPTVTGTTTSGMPNPCKNGGYLTSAGTCYCPSSWTGPYCQAIRCQNGGTQSSDKTSCTCSADYTGQFCEFAMCAKRNPILRPGYGLKSLVLVVQNTASMEIDINDLKDYITTVTDEFITYHPYFIVQWSLVVFNAKYDSVVYSGADAYAFQRAVHSMFLSATSIECKKPVLTALLTALKLSQKDSYIYVLTDSEHSDSSQDIIDVYNRADAIGATVNFIVTPNTKKPTCASTPDSRRIYADISAFTGGEYFNPYNKQSVNQILYTMPTIFRSARVIERQYDDCTQLQDFYLPVDSHTSAFTVQVNGYLAGTAFFDPEGGEFSIGRAIVNDVQIKVAQAITPCGTIWEQFGHQCYHGVLRPATWQAAKAECNRLGGTLANILSGEKQAFLNYELQGLNYWTGLNDQAKEGTFVWDGPLNLQLDPYFTNWAANEPMSDPTHQKNCVWVQTKMNVNGTVTDARWYAASCGTELPYVCQKSAYDGPSNTLPAGQWRIAVQSKESPTGVKGCSVRIKSQTNLFLETGFVQSADNDFPSPSPTTKVNTNRAAILSSEAASHVDFVDLYATNGTLLSYVTAVGRKNCRFDQISMPFTCPAPVFQLTFAGHDGADYAYMRIRDTVCLSQSATKAERQAFWKEYVDAKSWQQRPIVF